MLRNALNSSFLAAIVTLFMVTGAQAQHNTATANGQAVVISTLSIGGVGGDGTVTSVDFGNISSSTAFVPFLDPTGTSTDYVGTSPTVGMFTITGESGNALTVTWPGAVDMTDGTNHLQWTLVVSGIAGVTPSASASSILSTTGGAGLQTYSPATLTGGEYTLYVGGKLGGTVGTGVPAPLSSQAAATYIGTAAFTVEYN